MTNQTTWTVEIPLKLPSLNDYIRACRANRFMGAAMKKQQETAIGHFLQPLPRFSNPVRIVFRWTEATKRRDLDNICFAKKFILDAMVKAGKLEDDNRRMVSGFTDEFFYGDDNKVELVITEVQHDGKARAAHS